MVHSEQSGKLEGVAQAQAQAQAQAAPPAFRPLRLIIILFILLASTGAGFQFKSQANPGAEPSGFSSQPPQYLNVYDAGGVSKINVTVILAQGAYLPDYARYQGGEELRGHGYTSFNEQVSFSATATGPAPPKPIVLTSSIRPLTTAGGGLAPIWWMDETVSPGSFAELKNPVSPIDQANRFAISFPFTRDQGDTWSDGGTVFFKVPIIFQDNGSIFGHLPSAGAYSTLYPPVQVLEAGYDTKTGRLKTVLPANPVGPSGLPAGESNEDLYAANDYSFTEIIENIVSAVADRQTAYMNPSPDISGGSDWVWHSTGIDGLEPVFKMIDLGAIDSQNQAAFYSGIAFGVAGSALIALVGEIPEERRRKSRTRALRQPAHPDQ